MHPQRSACKERSVLAAVTPSMQWQRQRSASDSRSPWRRPLGREAGRFDSVVAQWTPRALDGQRLIALARPKRKHCVGGWPLAPHTAPAAINANASTRWSDRSETPGVAGAVTQPSPGCGAKLLRRRSGMAAGQRGAGAPRAVPRASMVERVSTVTPWPGRKDRVPCALPLQLNVAFPGPCPLAKAAVDSDLREGAGTECSLAATVPLSTPLAATVPLSTPRAPNESGSHLVSQDGKCAGSSTSAGEDEGVAFVEAALRELQAGVLPHSTSEHGDSGASTLDMLEQELMPSSFSPIQDLGVQSSGPPDDQQSTELPSNEAEMALEVLALRRTVAAYERCVLPHILVAGAVRRAALQLELAEVRRTAAASAESARHSREMEAERLFLRERLALDCAAGD